MSDERTGDEQVYKKDLDDLIDYIMKPGGGAGQGSAEAKKPKKKRKPKANKGDSGDDNSGGTGGSATIAKSTAAVTSTNTSPVDK